MNKKTKKALEESIAHWERMRASRSVTDFFKERPSDGDCALCNLFIRHDCKGCPVMERTGEMGCEKSPYIKANKALFNWERDSVGKGRTVWRTVWRRAATREINFLRSLR